MPTETTVYKLDKPSVGGDADVWGGFLNTDLDDLDTFLARPRVKKNAPVVGPTTTLDLSTAHAFEFTIDQITTVAVTNVPATLPDLSVPYTTIVLKVTNGGAFAVTWPASFVWAGGAAPSLQAAGVDIIVARTFDAGTTWYAVHVTSVSRVVRVPFSAVNKTSQILSSGAERSVVSHSLAAGTLNRDGMAVRITVAGKSAVSDDCELKINFGATTLVTSRKDGGNKVFRAEAIVWRRGAALQDAVGDERDAIAATITAPTENTANAILIDVRHGPGGEIGIKDVTLNVTIEVLDPNTTSIS